MSTPAIAIAELNQVTRRIISCAIEVHRQLGPGLLESTYEQALAIEFEAAGMNFQRQVATSVLYKRITGKKLGLLIKFQLPPAHPRYQTIRFVSRCSSVLLCLCGSSHARNAA